MRVDRDVGQWEPPLFPRFPSRNRLQGKELGELFGVLDESVNTEHIDSIASAEATNYPFLLPGGFVYLPFLAMFVEGLLPIGKG